MLKLDKSIYLIYGNFFTHIYLVILAMVTMDHNQKSMLSFDSWLEGNVVKRIVV